MNNWKEFENSEENWEDLIKKLKPGDYYFQLDAEKDGFEEDRFFVTPKVYYDNYGYLLDNWIPMGVFPSGFAQTCDSTYEYNGNAQVGRQLLLNAGFIERRMFDPNEKSLK